MVHVLGKTIKIIVRMDKNDKELAKQIADFISLMRGVTSVTAYDENDNIIYMANKLYSIDFEKNKEHYKDDEVRRNEVE